MNSKNFRKVAITLLLSLTACAQQSGSPKLSNDAKLAIRNAQIALYQKEQSLHASKEWGEYQQALLILQNTVQVEVKKANVDLTKFNLGDDLEFHAVEQPKPQVDKK